MSAIFEKSQVEQIRRRSPDRFVLAATLLLALGASLWLARVQILRAAADFWIVSNAIAAADVVAIFGGGIENRSSAAAGYFHHNLVKKILVANIRESQAESVYDAVPLHTAANRNALLELGVPEEAIEIFGDSLANTYQEALALRAWADRNDIHAVIVPTEIFPSRRVQWALQQAFRNSNVRVRVVALASAGSSYTREDWWRHGQGRLQFKSEISKYFYYRWKY